jgi:hypothetical protein
LVRVEVSGWALLVIRAANVMDRRLEVESLDLQASM